MNWHTFLVRLAGSSIGKRLYSKWSLQQRTDLLLTVWRGLNSGLDYRQRYVMMTNAYRERRMYKMPITTSEIQGRMYSLFKMVEVSKDVPGAIVEAGVGLGHSLAAFASAVAFFQLNKTVYGFDSFEGFPQASEEDFGPRVDKIETVAGWKETSQDMISEAFRQDLAWPWSLLARHEVEVKMVPGFFESTMPQQVPERIALLHVDCDLYESYRTVLKACLPQMSPGGLVIFDEYGTDAWPGAKRAADEVCEQQHLTIEYFEFARRYGVQIPA